MADYHSAQNQKLSSHSSTVISITITCEHLEDFSSALVLRLTLKPQDVLYKGCHKSRFFFSSRVFMHLVLNVTQTSVFNLVMLLSYKILVKSVRSFF